MNDVFNFPVEKLHNGLYSEIKEVPVREEKYLQVDVWLQTTPTLYDNKPWEDFFDSNFWPKMQDIQATPLSSIAIENKNNYQLYLTYSVRIENITLGIVDINEILTFWKNEALLGADASIKFRQEHGRYLINKLGIVISPSGFHDHHGSIHIKELFTAEEEKRSFYYIHYQNYILPPKTLFVRQFYENIRGHCEDFLKQLFYPYL